MSLENFLPRSGNTRDFIEVNPATEYGRYLKEKGYLKHGPVPGAVGLGSGISHYAWKVSKNDLKKVMSSTEFYKSKEYRNMVKKNENDRRIKENARTKKIRNNIEKQEKEIKNNIASIVYSDEVYNNNIDIDRPISLSRLAKIGKEIVQKERYNKNRTHKSYGRFRRSAHSRVSNYNAPIDDIIDALRKRLIKIEQDKVSKGIRANANKTHKYNGSSPVSPWVQKRHIQSQRNKYLTNHLKSHVDKKVPKIEKVLEKLREEMVYGLPEPKEKPIPKEENLLKFPTLKNELASLFDGAKRNTP